MSSRFDYVKYDDESQEIQKTFKIRVSQLEEGIEMLLSNGRAKSMALTKLEEVYMWIGKGIRDYQIERINSAPLQEERTNS